jgi:protein-L-isoaspartate(D-aspartate) O-methyltransferase
MLRPGLSVMLPDGLTLADGCELDPDALAATLEGPLVEMKTGVRTGAGQVFWGLGLWLAACDPRSCTLAEELAGGAGRLPGAPLRGRELRVTAGIVDSGGIAVLTAISEPGRGLTEGGPADRITLEVAGFGQHAFGLASALAAHIRAWDEAGQPGAEGLHVDAYPRSAPGQPDMPAGALLIERPGTRFAVYHA